MTIDNELAWSAWAIILILDLALFARFIWVWFNREVIQAMARLLGRLPSCRRLYALLFRLWTYEAPDCQHWLLPRLEGRLPGFVLRAIADLSVPQLRIAGGRYWFTRS